MTFVALACGRHSRGATTTALALAAAWPPARRLLVVEADSAGGDVAARARLRPEPNLLTLAASARAVVEAEDVWAHGQRLPGDPGAEVLTAPTDPRQARAALASAVSAGLADALAALDADVIVDVGRIDADSPALALYAGADVRAVVVRPTLTDVDHLQVRLAALATAGVGPSSVVVVGEGRWSAVEVARAAGAGGVAGVMADDPAAAAALSGEGAAAAKRLERSALWHSARRLAARLVAAGPDVDVVDAVAADGEVVLPAWTGNGR